MITAATPSEPAAPEVQTVQEPETVTVEPVTEPAEPDLEEGQVGMDEDNVLHFSKDFFGKQEPKEADAEDPVEQPQQAPQFYTVEDLGRTAISEVDVTRLDPTRIKEYWGLVQRVMTGDRDRIAGLEAQIAQMKQMQMQGAQQQLTQPTQPHATQQPPAKMSQKELTQAAVKRAREMLELSEDEDLDLYEPEHQMAFTQAAQEVSAAQIQAREIAAQQEETERFATEIRSRPDFGEFSRWFDRQLAANGRTPEQVNASLNELVRQRGPGVIRSIVGTWYKQFRDEIGRQASMTSGAKQPPQGASQRAQKPPVLEGSGGTSTEGRKVFDLSKFGDMDADGQAQMLRQMGIV